MSIWNGRSSSDMSKTPQSTDQSPDPMTASVSSARKRRAGGFVLLVTLLLIGLLGSVAVSLHLLVASQWRTTLQMETQLYSRVMAENGIEYARALLPGQDLNALLMGPDGLRTCPDGDRSRDPIPLIEGQRIDPDKWVPECDDGFPMQSGLPLQFSRKAPGGGFFFIRFSNNGSEGGLADLDDIVTVRSLGLVPTVGSAGVLPGLRNSVYMVEATLRQERSFEPIHPLTVFANSGDFQWEGDLFTIDGGDVPAVGWFGPDENSIEADFLLNLTEVQAARILGGELIPSVSPVDETWVQHPARQRLYRAAFWDHFLTAVPLFDRGVDGGLSFLENVGVKEIDFEGFLVVTGDLTLSGTSNIRGVLLHLGGGSLNLSDATQITGSVWLANMRIEGSALVAEPVRLKVEGSTSIKYDRNAIRRALAQLPPTQLGWRVMFPEMSP